MDASSMDDLIKKMQDKSCQYTKSGVDFKRCKGHTQGMMTPLYYGIGFNPTTSDGFTLPLFQPSKNMPIIEGNFKRRVVSDACEKSGFATIFDKVMGGGKNDFWDFSASDYSEAFGEVLDIDHKCSITSSSFIAFDPNDYAPLVDDLFVECVKMLPESPNDVLYSRFIEAFGYFAAIRGKYGGTKVEAAMSSNNLGQERKKSFVKYSGGNPTLNDDQSWSMSVLKNPTMTDFEIHRMSDFIASLGIASSTIVNNIKSKEDVFFKTLPTLQTFENIKEQRRPCKYRNFNVLIEVGEYTNDISIVTRTYHMEPTEHPNRDRAGYCRLFARTNDLCDRIYVDGRFLWNINFGCGSPEWWDCPDGKAYNINEYLQKTKADVRPIALVAPINSVEQHTTVVMGVVEYEDMGHRVSGVVPVTGSERYNDDGRYTKAPLFSCSPVRLPGMVPLDRYYNHGWGHTVGIPGHVPDKSSSLEGTLCYVYPPDTNYRLANYNGIKVVQLCVEY